MTLKLRYVLYICTKTLRFCTKMNVTMLWTSSHNVSLLICMFNPLVDSRRHMIIVYIIWISCFHCWWISTCTLCLSMLEPDHEKTCLMSYTNAVWSAPVLFAAYNISSFCNQHFKPHASFCSWAGQFESNLVRNSRRHVFSWRGSFIFRILHRYLYFAFYIEDLTWVLMYFWIY